MKKVIAYTDGGSRGNPGISGIGVYITDGDGKVLKEISHFIGTGTNNVAEYEAVIAALKALKQISQKHPSAHIELRMDSELVQRQLTGVYKVKHPDLVPRFTIIKKLETHFPQITYTHVRREKNKEADRLANEAMDSVRK